LTVIVAILLIGIVLIQKSKGGGLSSSFAGSNQIMGVRRTNDVVEKATWYLVAALVVLSILSVFVSSSKTTQAVRTVAAPEAEVPTTQAPITSQAPAAAASTEAPAAEAPAPAAEAANE
jgi:preprotein translocase subunit SecG